MKKTLRRMQIDEAFRRLQMLENAGKCMGALESFRNGEVKVFRDEEQSLIPDPEFVKKFISELEKLFGVLVFMSFRSDDLEMLSEVFCYIGPFPDEWPKERELLRQGSFPAFYANWINGDVNFDMFPPEDD